MARRPRRRHRARLRPRPRPPPRPQPGRRRRRGQPPPERQHPASPPGRTRPRRRLRPAARSDGPTTNSPPSLERLDPRRVRATPVAVEISEAHGIELLWDAPMPSAPRPVGSHRRRLGVAHPVRPRPARPATPAPAVIPGLVTIGQRDGNTVLVDLEALGSLAITGDPTAAENLARSIVVELACGDDLANSYVHTVGVDLDDLPQLDRAQVRDGAAPSNVLRLRPRRPRRAARAAPARHDLPTASRRRQPSAASSPSSPPAPTPSTTSTRFIEAAPPHRGVALIILGETPRRTRATHRRRRGRARRPAAARAHRHRQPAPSPPRRTESPSCSAKPPSTTRPHRATDGEHGRRLASQTDVAATSDRLAARPADRRTRPRRRATRADRPVRRRE